VIVLRCEKQAQRNKESWHCLNAHSIIRYNTMNLEILVQQAWSLRVKLRQYVETECLGKAARSTFIVRKERLNHAYARAHARYVRRQNKLVDISDD